MWTPYFSVQFPSAHVGRLAYAKLRELSFLHQLCPDESKLITTEEHVKAWEDKMGDDAEEEEWDTIGYTKRRPRPRPILDLKLPKKERAKVLMNQKGNSVADLAFVLGVQADAPGHEEQNLAAAERRVRRFETMGQKAQRRALERIMQLKKQQDKMRQLRAEYFNGRIESGVSLDKNKKGEIDAGVERKRTGEQLDDLLDKRDRLANTVKTLQAEAPKQSGTLTLISVYPDVVINHAARQLAELTTKPLNQVLAITNADFHRSLSGGSTSPATRDSKRESQRARYFLRQLAKIDQPKWHGRSVEETLRTLFKGNDDLKEHRAKLEQLTHLRDYDLPYATRALAGVRSAIENLQSRIDKLNAGLENGTYITEERGSITEAAASSPSPSSSQPHLSLPTVETPPLPHSQLALILWSSLHDAEHVPTSAWPPGVSHGLLAPGVKQGRSIHVFGDLAPLEPTENTRRESGEGNPRQKEGEGEGEEKKRVEQEKKAEAERRFMREKKTNKSSQEGGWFGGLRERVGGWWRAARGGSGKGEVVV